jgi:hypothetical protein
MDEPLWVISPRDHQLNARARAEREVARHAYDTATAKSR